MIITAVAGDYRTRRVSRPRTLLRRLLTVGGVLLVAPVLLVLSPLLVAVAAVVDLLLGRKGLGTARMVLFVVGWVVLAAVTAVAAFVLWVVEGFGTRTHTERAQARERSLETWWLGTLMGLLRTTLGLRYTIEGLEVARPGPVVVLARHVSLVDALVSPMLWTNLAAMGIRVVFMAELRNEPNIDVVGHRLPNHFVDRTSSDMGTELEAMTAMAADAGDDEALIIYPEGGLARPAKRRRIIEKLRSTDPAAAERAERLVHLLPPRSGGAAALLAGRPDADVIIVGHVGFEQLTDPVHIWRSVPLRDQVRIRLWRHPRAAVPSEREEFARWLADRWEELDAWVDQNLETNDEENR